MVAVIKTVHLSLFMVTTLAVASGCLGMQQSRSGDARAGRQWYDEQAGDSREEQAERLRRLEEANERLEATIRRMHAELGGQLDALQANLDVLTVKIDAQDRWLDQFEELVRRAERAGIGMTGLPEADGPVARFGPSGQITESPATVWGSRPSSQAGHGAAPQTTGPPESGLDRERARLPLLPADERAASNPPVNDDVADADPETGMASHEGLGTTGGQSGTSPADGGKAPPEGAVPDEARRLYEIAYQDLMRENYQLAMINFRSFLERHPNTALSDNAQYWIGEVYYAQGQYSVAIEEFRRVVEGYAGHEKVPAAYLKIALCFQKMKDIPTARRYLEYVIQNYPETREAQLAMERLPQL